jgi:hypothetical protein
LTPHRGRSNRDHASVRPRQPAPRGRIIISRSRQLRGCGSGGVVPPRPGRPRMTRDHRSSGSASNASTVLPDLPRVDLDQQAATQSRVANACSAQGARSRPHTPPPPMPSEVGASLGVAGCDGDGGHGLPGSPEGPWVRACAPGRSHGANRSGGSRGDLGSNPGHHCGRLD